MKIISLENAPIDIANRITTATNTQNKVEPKDFLALDATQDGIAEGFKKISIQYCYRRGETVLDASKGLDVQELAMSMAVSSSNIANVVIAKRNAGSLTDPNGHYPKIFDQSINAKEAWQAVIRWRAANHAVVNFASQLSGRDAQFAVHGNRFLEHLLVRSDKKEFDFIVVQQYLAILRKSADELYSDCYLAVLFKNAKKCEELRNAILKALPEKAPRRKIPK